MRATSPAGHATFVALASLLLALPLAQCACPPPDTGGEGEGEGAAAGEGEGEGEAGPCGAVTATPDCNGNVIESCNAVGGDHVVTTDCGAAPFVSATCGTVNAEFGVDCIAPQGQACFFIDANDSSQSKAAACDGGATAGCSITGATSSTCVSTSTTCSFADQGHCDGTAYVFKCEFLGDGSPTDGQRLEGDCAVLGGTCVPDVRQVVGGCYAASGSSCTPNWTKCGTGPDDPNAGVCPDNGTCP